jgi:hypothetical protein
VVSFAKLRPEVNVRVIDRDACHVYRRFAVSKVHFAREVFQASMDRVRLEWRFGGLF